MAIQYIGNTISGVSGDTKPTLTANEKGVIFVETDTNKIYQWDTDSWNITTAIDATTSAKGVASFDSGDFSVSSGAVSLADNITIAGNLTVSGTTNTVNATNLLIEDPLIVLAKDQSGSAAWDAGFVVERGNDNNMALIWDESTDKFSFIQANSEVGSTAGSVTINDYADLKAKNIEVTNVLTVTGNSTFGGNVSLGDSDVLNLGADNDVQLYHDNSNAYITNQGAGSIFITDTNGHIYLRPKTGEEGILIVADGAVELYHNAVKRFETTSAGAAVTGTLSTTGMTTLSAAAYIGNGGGSVAGNIGLLIDHDITSAYPRGLVVGNNAATFTSNTGNTEWMQVFPGGTTVPSGQTVAHITSAAFYEPKITNNGTISGFASTVYINAAPSEAPTGYNYALFVDAGDSKFDGNVGIGTSPSYKLHVNGATYLGGDTYLNNTGNKIEASASYNMISSNGYMRLQSNSSVYVALDQDNGGTDAVFAVRANGAGTNVFQVGEDGKVGIGTSAPDQKLTVGGHILLVGGDADNANKYSIIANEHYDTDDEEWVMMSGWSQAASHTLAFGGYDNAFNAATEIKFYTAADVTTRTGSERMVINSAGNVGIGVTPTYALHVEKASGTVPRIYVKSNGSNDAVIDLDAARDAYLMFRKGGTVQWAITNDHAPGANTLAIYNYVRNKNVMSFQMGGQANDVVTAIGCNPTSNWYEGNTVLMLGGHGVIFTGTTGAAGQSMWVGYNTEQRNSSFNAINEDEGSYMEQQNGNIMFKTAPSVTAGSAQTFTERFRIALAGQIGIGGANYGTSGQVLTSGGSGAAPSWADAGGGGGTATLTVASGQTVTQGKGVAVNTSGLAVPYDWGSDLKTSEQYGEINPHIQGVDDADSGWQAQSYAQNHICFYDYNSNKYLMFFRYTSGRANRAVSSGSAYADTGTYPTDATGEKPLNDLLGSGNEINQYSTWISCIGTINNSTGAITWSGYQKMPIEVQPTTAYSTHERAAGATANLGSRGIIYDAQAAASGNYTAGRLIITYSTRPAGSGTNQGANQYRRWLLQARYNSSTGKLDWSSTHDFDGSGTDPDNYLSSFFAGFCGTDKVVLSKQPTSSTTGIRFYVQTLAAFSAGSSPISGSGGTQVWISSSMHSTPHCVWNPSTDQVMLWGYVGNQSRSQGRMYNVSGTSLNNDNDTNTHNAYIAYSSVTGSQVLKHNSGTGAGDGCFFMLASWYGNSFAWSTYQMTNEGGSDQFDFASQTYNNLYGSTHLSSSGYSEASGAYMDIYTTDNTGEGAKGLGQMFRYGGSRPLQLAAGANIYSMGGIFYATDNDWQWRLQKWTLRYDNWGGEGTQIQAAFGTAQGTWTAYGTHIYGSADTSPSKNYKFRINYSQYRTAMSHWNPDYQGFVAMTKWYTPAVYKDNANGQYTSNSPKAYFADNVNVERLKTGNANLETAASFGTDPGPYVGLAKTTVTGNGSNTVDINIVGSVDENQSGLLPGVTYYINHEGSAIPGVPYDSMVDINIGTAISATKLIVANSANASGLSVASGATDLLTDD